MTAAETLTAARQLIDTPDKWCQGSYSFRGRCCAFGAFERASKSASIEVYDAAEAYLFAVARRRGFSSIEKLNDCSTHAEVMTAFDAAIELAGVAQ